MSISEKLVAISENVPKVYEAGKEAEKDSFWSVFQNNGKATSFYYACAYSRFDDTNFNPQYDFVASTTNNAFQNMFYNNKYLTDTKVGFDARNTTHIGGMFYNATALKTIRKLIADNSITNGGTNAFYNCISLEDIVIEGTLALSITFAQSSKLTAESIESIINSLSATTSNLTLTLNLIAVNSAFQT